MKDAEIKKLLEVGVLLSAERELDCLLEKILNCMMELTHCDAGTLYLREGDALVPFSAERGDGKEQLTALLREMLEVEA